MKNTIFTILSVCIISYCAQAQTDIKTCMDIYCPNGCYMDDTNQPHCCETEVRRSCLDEEITTDEQGCRIVQKISCYNHECCMPDGTCQSKIMKQVLKNNDEDKCEPETVWYCPGDTPQDECVL